ARSGVPPEERGPGHLYRLPRLQGCSASGQAQGGEVVPSYDGGLPGPSRIGNRGDLASARAGGRTQSGSARERSPLPGGRVGLRGGPPDDGEVAGELPYAHRVGRGEDRGEGRGLHVGAVRGNDRPIPAWPRKA